MHGPHFGGGHTRFPLTTGHAQGKDFSWENGFPGRHPHEGCLSELPGTHSSHSQPTPAGSVLVDPATVPLHQLLTAWFSSLILNTKYSLHMSKPGKTKSGDDRGEATQHQSES